MIRRFVPLAAAAVLAALVMGCNEQQQAAAVDPDAVAITVTDKGFEPAEVQVPAGKPITLVFTRKTNQTCATEVVWADTKAQTKLPLNKPVVVKLPARDAGTLDYACAMDMIKGKVVVQ
jgi:plastocyanin domain-containing protein